ncbi:GNAT family N-acetyltransferase [Paenibacillus sp. WQ 127069]|uniref:GNAT family N-acetyltransferase n=1 Tax=Paenibacillus baimaensis TaxID=2982185 RepID=A0ABT2UEZ6_9BACL|nr:GNAT family N-acetyltransferase [Paenibacillus sp. WQ 127069]MCU6793177.1 GNAT family N-acetyltransferase [Paenibacillus sp. WQ 127069]
MYKCRQVMPSDYLTICNFPLNAEELFYMYPQATFPLTVDQLEAKSNSRLKPMVLLGDEDRVIGYANIYDLDEGLRCWLGNVIVSPEFRGNGAAEYLIRSMMSAARDELHVKALHLVCHNTNTRALMFYTKLNFKPYEITMRTNNQGQTIAGILMKADLR